MTTTSEEIPPKDDAVVDVETPEGGDDDNLVPPPSREPGPFALAVDPAQKWRASELKICSFARPHMRAFHVSLCSMSYALHVTCSDIFFST